MTRTVVVGGGIAGLAAAYARRSSGSEVVVLERASEPGGVIRSVRREGFLLECGPNTVRPTAALVGLVADLGLSGELLLTDPRLPRYVDFRGRLRPVPMSPSALLTTSLLSPLGKLRLLAEPIRRRGSADVSVRDFFARRLGPEVADRLVAPFISGIFAGDASRLVAAAAFPRLARWESAHGSLLAGALHERRPAPAGPKVPRGLLSFRDGLATLPSALAASLGAGFRPGSEARGIEPQAGRWSVSTAYGQLEAEEVIVAAEAPAAAGLVRGFAPEAAEALAGIHHPPLAVLHLAWRNEDLARPLSGFGHLVVPGSSRRILGAVWSSSLFPGRAPDGFALMTVFLGGVRDPEAASLSDDALLASAAQDLSAEGLTRRDPRLLMLTRWARAIPQYERGHLERMEALSQAEAAWPGLRFLGNYRGGISVGNVVESALAI